MTRRDVMALVATAVVAVQGCANQPPDQLKTNIGLVVSGSQSIVTALGALPSVPADVLAKSQAALADVQANANAIVNATAPAANAAQQLLVAVNTLAQLVLPFFPQASAYVAIVSAVVSLATVIVGMVGAKPASAPPAGTVAMTPSHAAEVIRGAR